jgi:predicted DNA-binding transcriptional regulator YafY
MIASRPPIRRFSFIDAALRRNGFPNAPRLANELEVSRRTIMRDLEFMRDQLGAPIEYHPVKRGFHYTNAGFTLPSVRITEGELLALFLADTVLEQYEGTPFEKELRSAFDKLTRNLPDEVSVSPRDLERAYSFSALPAERFEVDVFRKLSEAVLKRKQIRAVYHTFSTGKTSERLLDPYHLANIGGSWYLFAWCHTRRDVRMFAPGRMDNVRFTGKRVEVPEGFDSRAYLDGAFQIIAGKKRHKVRLKFSPAVAPYISERRWHRSQTLTDHADGGVTLAMQVSDLDEVLHWVLSWGTEVEVLRPKRLSGMVAEVVGELAARLRMLSCGPRRQERKRR